MYYLGIGINFLSIIHRSIYWGWKTEERMIIPKIIGKVQRGFLRHFRSDRILRMKNRIRANQIEEL
ncbi:hypothetical protein [Clostridium sp.]|uniref:hypothetical protein n=1 Tax=Clostridium sp. TaxID=1506 RepID=UPI0028425D9F|nr:hypothetical protein [Clostridium sp.]MDR3593814.1 hypothetical protein [Clostridium sp.]